MSADIVDGDGIALLGNLGLALGLVVDIDFQALRSKDSDWEERKQEQQQQRAGERGTNGDHGGLFQIISGPFFSLRSAGLSRLSGHTGPNTSPTTNV